MKLNQKVAVITGAGSGIGSSTAEFYAVKGARVMVCDVNEISAFETVERIKNLGGYAKPYVVDVTDDQAVEALFDEISRVEGAIDYLVNNVGIEIKGDTHNFSISDYDHLFNVNVKSIFLCTKAAAAKMIPNRSGAIVNLASVASFKTWPSNGIYSVTKAAVHALTKAFAVDLAKYGVRVNAVAPAIVATAMTERSISKETNKIQARINRNQLHPLGRMAEPVEIAKAIYFLNSDDSSFTTGSCLVLDGGLLA